MFRYSTPSSAPSYSDAFVHNAAANFSAALPTLPTQIPRSAGGYLDGGNVNGFTTQFASAGVSSPPSYCSSLPSLSFYNIQRSISSHSLPLHHLQLNDSGSAFFSPPSTHQLPPLSSSPSSSSGDLFEFTSSCPVRRVFSTGDLQGMNGSPPPQPSGDSCGQDAGGPFSQKVGRYSAEERKERIERYRVKRHQRNFNKKITYACRKSLADSRPRVKGRFARNGDAEAEADEREPSENSYEYCGYSDPSNDSCNHGQYKLQDGGSCNDASHATALVVCADNGEWWWRIPGANTDEAERQRQAGFDVDEELWATLGDMMTVNLAS